MELSEKAKILKDLIDIEVCNGKLQGAWSSLDGVNEKITNLYENHIFDIAYEYGFEIPPMEDYDRFDEDYRNREERATDVFWALEKKFTDILLSL